MAELLSYPENRTTGWLWLLPRLAFVLFIAAVAALLWLSSRADDEEQRATLISDMLWLEQNLHFILTHNEELLGQIGSHQTKSAAAFEPPARALIDNQTGLRRVGWFGEGTRVRFELPSRPGNVDDDETPRLARSLGKPAYGNLYAAAPDDWWFDVFVPLYQEGRFFGVVSGSYSLRRMLEESVPWWLAERYRIVVVDAEGKVLASRTKLASSATAGSGYRLAFEPPGHGLLLEATPYRSPAPLAGRLLSAALVFLALLVLWSLWILRRHVQRRLLAEQALREEHAFRTAMEDSVQTGLRARDLDGRITYVNPAFCRMVGYDAAELVGKLPPMPYWVEDDIEATQALNDRILAGQGPEDGFEIHLKRNNGEIFTALIHEAPLIDAAGRQTGWMSSVIDVSAQRRAEELARQQQERLQAAARLITMGEMASSLAHELNQPLAAIASYNAGCLNLLAAGAENFGEIEHALKKSTEQAQRAGRIIRRIYEFVRRSEPKTEPCDVGQLVDEMMGLIETDARRHGVRLRCDIAAELPAIRGDRILLGQAILNLMRNGIDAMRDIPRDKRLLAVSVSRDDDHVHIEVADHGCGIQEETAARMFEPFFTTKAEGMGMGLNICRSVIEAHKGRLWFTPNPEGGSIFHILLPLRSR